MAQSKVMEFPKVEPETYVDELAAGTYLLSGQYKIVKHLNSGGFGITYLAKDSLDRDVVIKECFLPSICQRSGSEVVPRSVGKEKSMQKMVDMFVREAQNLARLEHPNIVAVHQVFNDNNTAYMAMDFIQGRDLLDLIDDPKVSLTPKQIVVLTKKMLSAIDYVHAREMLHRDISPDNIIVKQDGEPTLIDFGATRDNASEQSRALTAHLVVKDGYSPQEFYIKGAAQGAYSDLYSFGATLYHLVAGVRPANGQVRLVERGEGREDSYQPLAGRFKEYPAGFLEAIDQSLNTLPRERIQSIDEWLGFLDPSDDSRASHAAAATREPVSAETKSKRNYVAVAASVVVLGAVAISQTGAFSTTAEDAPNAPVNIAQLSAQTTTPPIPELPADVLSVITQGDIAPSDLPQDLSSTTASALPADVLSVITQGEPSTSESDASDTSSDSQEPDTFAALVENNGADLEPQAATPEISEDLEAAPVDVTAAAANDIPSTVTTPAAQADIPPNTVPAAPALPIAQSQVSVAVWDVNIPFTEAYRIVNGRPAVIISRIDPSADLSIAGSWISVGTRITAVNDKPIQVGGTLAGAILDQLVVDPDGYTRTAVTFVDPDGEEQTRLLSSKVVRMVSLANGIDLMVEDVDGQWTTNVRSISQDTTTSLQVGDQIFRDRTTGIAVNGPETFEGVITQLAAENLGAAVMTVLRDSQIVTATMPLALEPDSE